jgi:outer membrane protein OmpA-like peptidoglycan-associated protein/Mg-chelatase subunit ChlD
MGKEINTSGDDIGFKITEDGKKAFFSKDENAKISSSLLLLLDVSGSMTRGKIDALKQASKNVCITGIQNDAEISILTFDGRCYAPVRSELNFTKNYDEINDFIDKIAALGETPMYEAYEYACNYMKKNSSNTDHKMIILMTDGEANGCAKLDDVFAGIKKNRLVYKTQTIGFDVKEKSKPYNDLHLISKTTNGKYFHASEPNDLGVAFENAIKDLYEMGINSSKKGIYSFEIPAELRPENVVHFTGKTTTSKGENKQVDIRIVDLTTHKEVYRTKSNPEDGNFYFVLPLGKIYGFFVEDISIYPVSDHIDLRKVETAMHITKDIPLITIDEMIKENIAIPVNNLFFDFASSEILPLSIPELKLHANIIKSANYKVEISGYTDDVGSETYNLNLSQKRADAVREFLIKEGCAPDQLNSVGYGIRRIDTNKTETGRARNRRVELEFRENTPTNAPN